MKKHRQNDMCLGSGKRGMKEQHTHHTALAIQTWRACRRELRSFHETLITCLGIADTVQLGVEGDGSENIDGSNLGIGFMFGNSSR